MSAHFNKSIIVIICVALILSTLLVYWQVRNFDFINYDDNLFVSENPNVFSGLNFENIKWAFTTPQAGNWLPLTWISFMLDCQLFGLDPGPVHLVNVFFHIVNTLLLFLILKQMTNSIWPSAFVAAAFALHPMHVESVAWISERKDVLSTFFFLLTLAAYIVYVKKPGFIRYFLALFIFVCGLLAKPMIVTLPLLLLLLDFWPLNRFGTAAKNKKTTGQNFKFLFIEKLPFFALSIIWALITFLVQRRSGAVPDINALPLTNRFANALLSCGKYLWKVFAPENLSIIYPLSTEHIRPSAVILCAALLILISAAAIYLARKQKYFAVGWFWFLITLLPVIGLIQSGAQARADRYTYIPYIGLFIVLAWGVFQFLPKLRFKRNLLGVFVIVILTLLALRSYKQTGYWQNSITLFSHAANVTKDNYIAHDHLAHYYRNHGNSAYAIDHYLKALQIAPHYLDTLFGIGCTYADRGDSDKAIKYFHKLLELGPHSGYAAHTHVNLGAVFRRQGKLQEAVEQFNAALRISPDFPEAHYEFAVIYFLQGKSETAVDEFRTTIRLKPYWPVPMNDLAGLMATHPEIKNRDTNEAVRLAERACELTNYTNPGFLATLAASYASAGRFPEAIDTAKKSIAVAEAQNQPVIKNAVQKHLSFYLQHKPYIEQTAIPK